MQIAVYSGSFDPLHTGHLAVLEYLDSHFDKVILVVSPQNPFKSAEKAESAQDRFKAAEEAVRRHKELTRTECSDIELDLGLPSYTHRTLEALQECHPGDNLTFVMGADNLPRFRNWHNYDRILLDFNVLVYPRSGTDAAAQISDLLQENACYNLSLADMPTIDISSTQIRERIRAGEDVAACLM